MRGTGHGHGLAVVRHLRVLRAWWLILEVLLWPLKWVWLLLVIHGDCLVGLFSLLRR